MRSLLHSQPFAGFHRPSHDCPEQRSWIRTPFLWLIHGAAVVVFLVSLSGCGVTSLNGITYGVYLSIATPPIDDAPTYIDQTYTATCPAGQYVLAGGFDLSGPRALVDWAAAHSAPGWAQPDSNGLYRPIPQLVRVVDSESTSDGHGWKIRVVGQAYPADARPIAVYAYCAAGMSTAPRYIMGPFTTSSSSSGPTSIATCPAGTIVSGGGYRASIYPYDDSGDRAFLPIYSSLPDSDHTWLVAPDFAPKMNPAPNALFVSFAVCVSTQDFSLAGGEIQDERIAFTAQGNQSMQVGGDTDYAYQHPTPTPCPAGTFTLPPAFDFSQSLTGYQHNADVRMDGIRLDTSLTTWELDLSVGGAATYPQGDLIDGDAWIECLMPK